jgi:iron complex transport system permease protein
MQIRFPRFLLTILTGFVLGGVGFTFQILLNNPLAEPYILGISSGAALGSIVAMLFGWLVLAPVLGFLGAFLTMFLVWRLANLGNYFTSTKLLLSGIIVSMFFSAFISLLMYLNQRDIGNIINILMGNLGRIFSHSEYKIFIGIFLGCLTLMIYLFGKSSQLQIITTGDEVATSLGINVQTLRRKIFIVSSILTGIVVSYAGIIGFVGLIVPHLTRLLGVKKHSLIVSSFFGSGFLLICDLLAMHIAVIEVPVGVITAFIGCPFFILLMMKNK